MTLPIAIRCTALLAALLLASCGDYDKVTKDETGQQVGSPSGGAPSTPGAAGAGAGGMQPGPDSTPEPAATPEPAVTPEPAATPEPAVTPEPTTTEPGPPAVEASCDMDATACGGDVAGTWTVKDCPLTLSGEVDMAGFGLGCTTATVTSGTLSVSGTWTADGEGGFTDDTTTTGMEVMEMPPECLTVSGTVTTCDRVGGPVQSSLGYSMFECVDNADTGGCTCTGTIDQQGGMGQVSIFATQEGLYTAMDNTLGLGDNGDFGYCAADGAMVLTYAAAPKIGTVTGSIVLQKQ